LGARIRSNVYGGRRFLSSFFGEEKGFEFENLREKSGLLKVILSV
jgi:hypothetical protein